jgi:hypothetical protein
VTLSKESCSSFVCYTIGNVAGKDIRIVLEIERCGLLKKHGSPIQSRQHCTLQCRNIDSGEIVLEICISLVTKESVDHWIDAQS